MKRIDELLKNRDYLAELLNGPCAFARDNNNISLAPVNAEWIDLDASDIVTLVYHKILPEMPYLTYVIVERNPDTLYMGTCVDAPEKLMRYYLITLIPDTEYPYDVNFPLITMSGVSSLISWEMVRAVLAASEQWMKVVIDEPRPPILNRAYINWVSLYLGRKPYVGSTKLSEQWVGLKETDKENLDTHFVNVRDLAADPILQRLLAAYDSDYPEPPRKGTPQSGEEDEDT